MRKSLAILSDDVEDKRRLQATLLGDYGSIGVGRQEYRLTVVPHFPLVGEVPEVFRLPGPHWHIAAFAATAPEHLIPDFGDLCPGMLFEQSLQGILGAFPLTVLFQCNHFQAFGNATSTGTEELLVSVAVFPKDVFACQLNLLGVIH